jgi:hypothetical protein
MAMRDPGTPGRNPFFDHGPDAELGDPVGPAAPEPDAVGYEPYDDPFGDQFAEELPPGFDSWPGGGGSDGGSDPLGTLAALVDALQGAQPEATEHLVAAAHELVLAVKTVVDATEAVLAASRAASHDPSSSGPVDDAVHDPFASEPPPTSRSEVRRIDLA